jgi:signal transduction histidine kinase
LNELERLNHLIQELKIENDKLKKEIEIIKLREIEREKTLNKVILERSSIQKQSLNTLIKDKELQSQLRTWQRIVDEMAHSINTDVFAAISNLSNVPEDNEFFTYVNKAIHNISRIRDIANLIMWDLNKERLPEAKELHIIDIGELIKSQIGAIKDGIDSLRLSIREHKQKLFSLEIPIQIDGNCEIEIDDNIEPALELILKDLIRNAFQYTDEENPSIKISLKGNEFYVEILISNNRLISQQEIDWFNKREEEIVDESIPMSKSAKVGLRLVKKWARNLNTRCSFSIDKENGYTNILIQVPRLIKYDKI